MAQPPVRPVRQSSLAQQIYEILQARILSGEFPGGSAVPSEEQLAAEYAVSRTTIRGAIDRLVAQGLLRRRHGVGTFITKSRLISNPLDQFVDFQNLIASNGYKPAYKQINARLILADETIQKLLELSPGDSVLETNKYWTADGEPVVYCRNHIPVWVFPNSHIPQAAFDPGITEPIFEFFEDFCHQTIDHFVATIQSCTAGNCELIQITNDYDPSTPVLVIDEVGYNQDERPIHRSIEYHPNNLMTFKLVRRKSVL